MKQIISELCCEVGMDGCLYGCGVSLDGGGRDGMSVWGRRLCVSVCLPIN